MPALTKIEIKKYLSESEEDFIEGYGYVIKLDENDPVKFNTSKVRKILPAKLKIYKSNIEKLNFNIIKDGRELKKLIPFELSFKPSLKFFLDKDECLIEFNNDKLIAIKILKNKHEKLKVLEDELNLNYQYLM